MNSDITNHIPRYLKLLFVCLICSDILLMYGFGANSVNYYLTVILGGAAIFYISARKGSKSVMPSVLWILILDMAFVEIVTRHAFPKETLMVSLPLIVIWTFVNSNNIESYLRIYKKIGIVIVIYFYIQFAVYIVTGSILPRTIPGLPLCDSFDELFKYGGMQETVRCSSLFSEPSYLCRFLLPLIIVELFKKEKVDFKVVFFYSVPFVLTTSGTGLIALAVLFVFSYISNISEHDSYRTFRIIAVPLFAIIFAYILFGTEIGGKIIERTDELSWNYKEGVSRSGYIRMWLGYDVFNEYSLHQKILGDMNMEQYSRLLMSTEFGRMTDESLLQFSGSGFSVLLLRQGFIGLVIMISFFVSLWKNASLTGKAIIITFITYMITEFVYPGSRFGIYLIMAYCLNKQTSTMLNLK